MGSVLVAFLAGVAGAAIFNYVLAPFWHFYGLRDAIYAELLVCAGAKPWNGGTGIDPDRLRRLAAELMTFDQSASRFTRAVLARKGYRPLAEAEALMALSNSLETDEESAMRHLLDSKQGLRLPDTGFPESLRNRGALRVAPSRA
jgi:hypothetical protein